MKAAELEAWAISTAPRNPHPFDFITPVLLYRNDVPALCGAYTQMDKGGEVVFTAAHGFSLDYPACAWSFRKLLPEAQGLRPIVKAIPMRGTDDDVAICTPASLVQLSAGLLPNFYAGWRGQKGLEIEFGGSLTGTARSILSGEDVRLHGEVYLNGKLHVALDVEVDEGQSGSVFVDESTGTMYILRAYSPSLTRAVRSQFAARGIDVRGVTFAVRLKYA